MGNKLIRIHADNILGFEYVELPTLISTDEMNIILDKLDNIEDELIILKKNYTSNRTKIHELYIVASTLEHKYNTLHRKYNPIYCEYISNYYKQEKYSSASKSTFKICEDVDILAKIIENNPAIIHTDIILREKLQRKCTLKIWEEYAELF